MKNNQNEYTTLSLVGSLFSADMLSLMAQGNSSHQSVEDYKLLPGLRFSDEISRSFNIARAFYNEYKKNRNESAAYDTTKKFIEDFFTKSLNYDSFITSSGKTIKNRKYPVTLYAAKDVPIIIAPYTFTLDELDSRFTVEGVTSRKKSAFSLAQLFLNASNECTWAFATNGLELRLLRDSDSLVRPAYLSFDIESILSDSRYPDFVALWYLIHSSRVNIWEAWRQEGITNGTRVREGLRDGVTNALLHLGAGFLQTEGEGNNALLNALKDGKRADGVSYTQMDFYKALLREVYRFLFLSTIEERNLLFAHTGDEAQLTPELRKAHKIYREGYSIHRLAEKSRRIPSNDKYSDIWHGVQVVFKSLQKGNEALDLSPLGGLFRSDQCPLLDACNIDNEHLLKAIRCLRWCYINGKLTFTDYRNMGTEEFGSVYESLLELVPHVELQSKSFSFVGIGDENGIDEEGNTAGNARKTSGSYYTNAELVQSLIKSTLEPSLYTKIAKKERECEITKRPVNYEEIILNFSVIDPACGSGHFLLAAARRIAEVLVEKRLEDSEELVQSNELFRKALRDVISNCIYGVDMNDMAVELTRTALWLEGYEPGKPLEFLSHHIKCGNSLVGVFDLNVLKNGIPDSAYEPLTGDEKSICNSCKRMNTSERIGLCGDKDGYKAGYLDFYTEQEFSSKSLASLMTRISFTANDTLEDENKKEELYNELLQNEEYLLLKTACDLYVGAFFINKTSENYTEAKSLIPTTKDIFDIRDKAGEAFYKEGIREKAIEVGRKNKFFHWPIEFADVFSSNHGFDCILGNPPWDRIKIAEKEFFASRMPAIANAKNKAERAKLIKELKESTDPFSMNVAKQFKDALYNADATSSFVHFKDYADCRYPLTGVGDVNMYALFAELMYKLRSPFGTAGFIVPTGIATDDSTKKLFAEMTKGSLKSLYDFENREGLFPTVDSRFRFSLVSIAPKDGASDFAFFTPNVNSLSVKERHVPMNADDFSLMNPNTLTSPTFRAIEDYNIAKKIYSSVGIFINENPEKEDKDMGNPWHIGFNSMFHMSNDSNLFSDKPGKGKDSYEMLPLYEGKMMNIYDHRWNVFENGKAIDTSDELKADPKFNVIPEYWVPFTETVLRTTYLELSIVQQLRILLAKPNDKKAGAKIRELCNKSLNETIQSFTYEKDIVQKLWEYAEKHRPHYLIGWRDITNTTNARTTIATVVPFSAVNNKLLLFRFSENYSPVMQACLLANMDSMVLDYFARQKLGGVDLTYLYLRQFPIFKPEKFTEQVKNYIIPRVMALTYTTFDMNEWAQALWNDSTLKMRLKMLQLHDKEAESITDEKFVDREFSSAFLQPYIYDDAKRAILRAELDAYFARLYGLSRTELQYILDPHSVMGEDYPSETFRVLQEGEIAKYGEYRTQRLVLEAWDRME